MSNGFVDVSAYFPHLVFVVDDSAQAGEPLHVALAVEPETEVSAFGVLVEHVGIGTVEVPVEISGGVLLHAVLEGAAENGLGVDLPVRFCHDSPVDGSWRAFGTRTMVLDGIAHGEELLLGKPLAEIGVRHEDFARMDMVELAVHGQAEVVVGGNGVRHVLVGMVLARQSEALGNDALRVVALMPAVKGVVAREDGQGDVVVQGHKQRMCSADKGSIFF